MSETAARDAHLLALTGIDRIDALQEAVARLGECDRVRAAQLGREAYMLATQAGDELRAARCLLLLTALGLPIVPGEATDDDLRRALSHLASAQLLYDDLTRQLHVQADQLARSTQEDLLTGLASRRAFCETLALSFRRARRLNYPLSVALLDLDDFRRVNEAFSYAVGDEVLRRVAQVLREQCRSKDLLARYGGEEFALMLPGIGAGEVDHTAERFRQAVEQYNWSMVRPGLRVTLSVGVCSDLPSTGHEGMLALAEEKLLEAKQAGRNLVRG
ncbi:GGDEF domain-containing protein [Deinococcus peraridilitoris]|uniref:Diguanylate cyclase (GGDEF) domain-containing protein n=1 Tax=Deinococcus peraridilitoris (strain DSM 19664 / LMG 22246 / CIP 109416 / KR-200) TaxID=937777 RepID=K9ZYP8_DEIPD|nr:GGDEF domain-containing protein [Deinococcus peraridilitoris]AFZ66701.1 diguanylate cyclase (GGDEF) domain-containing protein [Deinococcus peraridilitoris DSM 19664]